MLKHDWVTAHFPEPGYFVEAGAHDGVGDSHTKSLEDIGWSGICVEPSSAFMGLQQSRKCKTDNRCLWDRDGEDVSFWQVHGNGIELSGIQECFYDHWDRSNGKLLHKKSVTLTSLLLEHGAPRTVQFFALDTEGSEYRILKAHDFTSFLFLALTVEHNGVVERREQLMQLLLPVGYILDVSTPIEDWYLHGSCQSSFQSQRDPPR